VQVRADGRLVAEHDRVWARGLTVTEPAHVAAAKLLREQFRQPRVLPARDQSQDLARIWPTTTARSASPTL
jgi:hypothetical protein